MTLSTGLLPFTLLSFFFFQTFTDARPAPSPMNNGQYDNFDIFEGLAPLREGSISQQHVPHRYDYSHPPAEYEASYQYPSYSHDHYVYQGSSSSMSTSHGQQPEALFYEQHADSTNSYWHTVTTPPPSGEFSPFPQYAPPQSNMQTLSLGSSHPSSSQRSMHQESEPHAAVAPVRDQSPPGHAPHPNHYTAPWEYTLQVDNYIKMRSSDENELVWKDGLTDNQKLVIVEHVQRIRPYIEKSMRDRLLLKVTARLARALLSNDETQINAAVEEIYPNDQRKRGASGKTWMDGLSKEEKIEVIEKMREVTHQSADTLRDLFLRRKIDSDAANQILKADLTTCRQYAVYLGFIDEDHPVIANWHRDASRLQKQALPQRMMMSGAHHGGKPLKSSLCFELLRRKNVPHDFGFRMLRADDRSFAKAILWLMGNRRNLPPI
ncbi:hypothetical protein CBS101457_000169 [Exobasidium rhododendri]|nr:hypothetical protein CBS101457_000169 [Exobasidium rhododendri]